MKIFGYTIPQLRKAITAFATPGVVALGVALSTDSPGGETVTSAEWLGVIAAMFITGGFVFSVKNAPKDPPAPVG